MKQVANLRQMSNDQLAKRRNEINISLMRQRGENTAGGPRAKNTMFIRKLRREKAQILTILRERELKINQAKA